ncbi:MAG: RNA-binding protein [Acidobacteria bacterium]|nr:MAG: RNA-binding protein [Acidobacteriota bacterium]
MTRGNTRWVEWYGEVVEMVDDEERSQVRLDVWLDVACLFRTRSEAQKACKGGKIDVNGQRAKSNRLMRVGDTLEISRPYGRKQRVAVRALADRHVAKTDARRLYDDLTPPPTPEEIEIRRMERVFRALMTPPRAPDKRQRRALRRIKGRDD